MPDDDSTLIERLQNPSPEMLALVERFRPHVTPESLFRSGQMFRRSFTNRLPPTGQSSP